MSISYVGVASSTGSSVSLPTFQAGDVAIVVAVSGMGTIPSLPSGWLNIGTASGAGSRAGYRVLQSGDTTTGTWTNAQGVGVCVYRGVDGSSPIDVTAAGLVVDGTALTSVSSTDPAASHPSSARYLFASLVRSRTITGVTGTGWAIDGGQDTTFAVATEATPYGTGTLNFSSSANAGFAAVSLALRPAGSSTFPIVSDIDTTSGTVTSNSSSWTLTYPTNIAAGDLLLLFVASDGTSSISDPFGGSPYVGISSGANYLSVFVKIAAGTETGTFTLSLAGSEQGSWLFYRIPAATWYGPGNGADKASTATGSPSQYPDPPSLDPLNWATEDTLWLAVCSVDTSRTIIFGPTTPDGYFANGSLVSGGSNGASLGWTRWEKAVASLDPGTFTISNSDDWAAATIAVRPNPTRYGSFTASALVRTTRTFAGTESSNLPFTAGEMTFGDVGGSAIGQSFVAGAYPLSQVRWLPRAEGSPSDSAQLTIESDSGGHPSGSVVATLDTALGSTLPTSAAGYASPRTVSCGPVALTAGATYWLVASRTGTADAVNYYAWGFGSTTTGLQYKTGSDWYSLPGSSLGIGVSFPSLSLDAVLVSGAGTKTGSFTADAIRRKTGISGSFSADALKRRSSGTLTFSADALLKRAQSGSLTADAVRKRSQSGSATADAVTKRSQSGSLTADAELVAGAGTRTGSLTANAALKRTISGTFTANAVIRKTASGTFTANAIIRKTASGTFTANAIIRKTTTGTPTANAVLKRTISASFTAAAVLFRNSGIISFSGAAVIRRSQPGSFGADAALRRTQTASGSSDAVIRHTQTGVFYVGNNDGTGGAVIIVPTTTIEGSFAAVAITRTTASAGLLANAVVRGEATAVCHADAIVRRAQAGSLIAAAVTRKTATGSSTAAAVLRATQSTTFAADAVFRRSQAGTATANAILKAPTTGAFSVAADLVATQSGSFSADAYIPPTAKSLAIDAVIGATITISVTAAGWIQGTNVYGLTADAVLWRSQLASVSADAVLRQPCSATFSANASIFSTVSSSFFADAISRSSRASSFENAAVIKASSVWTFSAAAIVRSTSASSFSTVAVISVTAASSLSVAATLRASILSSVLASAVLAESRAGSFGIDAILLRASTTTLSAESVLRQPVVGTFSADAYIPALSGTVSANAVFAASASGGFTAAAWVQGTNVFGLAGDAGLAATQVGALTSDALTQRTASVPVTVDAVLTRAAGGQLAADAAIRQTSTAIATADGVVHRVASASLTAAAIVRTVVAQTQVLDAVLLRPISASATAEGVLGATTTASFSAAAELVLVGRCVWLSPPNYDAISPTPTLTFRVPPAVGAMQFEIELDLAPTFDSPDLRRYRSTADPTGWAYHDGATWQPLDATGVAPAYAGNEARLMVNPFLAAGVWYRRVRAVVR